MRSTTILGLQATRLVSQAIRIFPRAHVRGKGGGGREGRNLPPRMRTRKNTDGFARLLQDGFQQLQCYKGMRNNDEHWLTSTGFRPFNAPWTN